MARVDTVRQECGRHVKLCRADPPWSTHARPTRANADCIVTFRRSSWFTRIVLFLLLWQWVLVQFRISYVHNSVSYVHKCIRSLPDGVSRHMHYVLTPVSAPAWFHITETRYERSKHVKRNVTPCRYTVLCYVRLRSSRSQCVHPAAGTIERKPRARRDSEVHLHLDDLHAGYYNMKGSSL